MSENTQASQEATAATNAVIGNFSLTLPAPNGAQLSVSGYIYGDESRASLDDRMDVCREALIRQQHILEIPVLEEKVRMMETAKLDLERAYADLLERQKKAPKSLPSQEQANVKNYPIQIKKIEEELAKAQARIAEVRKAG
ncbi:hypothetical protein [Paraburkholderia sp. Ac-20347]|uniref:hypothetical protein n=1 Tax=Paraburkholderia sp. Ac-20347 TaxID=2703892 RepID=UPI001980409B|nr:hypothetical protein [Paraburkholderia sp. Ac-20347]MBN3809416.1 hypothetical protein [Paraburkholderia sp. Ac-20347]